MAVTRIHCIVSADASREIARVADSKERILSPRVNLQQQHDLPLLQPAKAQSQGPEAQSGQYAGLCIKSI
jgi:hypothetical protein